MLQRRNAENGFEDWAMLSSYVDVFWTLKGTVELSARSLLEVDGVWLLLAPLYAYSTVMMGTQTLTAVVIRRH